MTLFESSRRKSEKNGDIHLDKRFGIWSVVVDGYKQTSEGLSAIWRDALKRARNTTPENPRFLILGLGGGGIVREIYRMFPGASIVAIEHDPEMIAIADQLRLYGSNPRPDIICADAAEALRALDQKFHVIAVDIFRGGKCSALLQEEPFLRALKAHLAEGGRLLVNVAGDREFLDTIALYFPRADLWRKVANYLGMFSA